MMMSTLDSTAIAGSNIGGGNTGVVDPTIPKSIGALLAEECTINPLSALPSFLELRLVDAAVDAGRSALKSLLDAIAATSDSYASSLSSLNNNNNRRIRATLARIVHKLIHSYNPELRAVITFIAERRCLVSDYTSASLAESLHGLKRAKTVFARPNSSQGRVAFDRNHGDAAVTASIDGGKASNNVRENGHTIISPTVESNIPSRETDYVSIVPLTHRDKITSALVLALGPYLKERMDGLYEKERDRLLRPEREVDSARNMRTDNGTVGQYSRSNQVVPGRERQGQSQQQSRAGNTASSSWSSTTIKKIRIVFLTIYPFLYMAREGTIAAYQWSYLVNRSLYYSPSLHALGLLVRRITAADVQQRQQQQQQQQRQRRQSNNGSEGRTENSKLSSGQTSSSALTSLMALGDNKTLSERRMRYILKVVRTAAMIWITTRLVKGWISTVQNEMRRRRRQWIMETAAPGTSSSASGGRNLNTNSSTVTSNVPQSNIGTTTLNRSASVLIPPPAPPQVKISSNSASTPQLTIENDVVRELPTDTTLCPLCHRPRVNPCASTSGYVFCYKCLVLYVREHEEVRGGGKCPVTNLPCREDQIVRIYEPVLQEQQQQQQQQRQSRQQQQQHDVLHRQHP